MGRFVHVLSSRRIMTVGTTNYINETELKSSFLNRLEGTSESQLNLTRNVLAKIDEVESLIGKSIYMFELNEVEDFLRNLEAKSISSLNTYYSTLKKYIEFVVETNTDKEVNTNIYKLSSSDMEKLINQEAHTERYIDREDLFKLISNAVNPQDKALFLLLFEGVRGKEYNELRLLEEKNIDFNNNIIRLSKKSINIKDRRTMFILKSAIKQTEYYYERKDNDNGEIEIAEYKINPKNYFVIKRVMHNNLGLEPYVANRIKVKIQKFAKEMGRSHLTGNTIYNSGLAERFLEHFEHRSPETISTIEVKQYLEENHESIAPATLRRIANYILVKQ